MPLSRIPTRSRTLAAKPRPCRCEIRWKARPVSSLPWQAEPPGAFGEHAILLGHHPPLSNQATTIGDQFARRGDRLLRALPLPLDSSLAAPDRKVRPISRPNGRGSTTAIGPSLQFCLQPIDSDRTVSRRAAERLGASRMTRFGQRRRGARLRALETGHSQ